MIQPLLKQRYLEQAAQDKIKVASVDLRRRFHNLTDIQLLFGQSSRSFLRTCPIQTKLNEELWW